MIDRYSKICSAWEEEFARNRRLHGERIRCRPGCSDCCGQLFQITELEAAVISAHVAELEEGERARMRASAAAYLEKRKAMVGAGRGPEAWGSLPPAGSRLPCPALTGQGACGIYDARPLICRKFGVPLYYADKPGQVFACELNFRAGDAIDDGELIQIQTGLHAAWKQVQRDYDAAGGYRDESAITVARAITEDFRARAQTT
ncbi:MAG: YkgJ family cysteine cluster protein [Bryobacterales bacterium]|nr:YkgJ family cysteine cluster protein [Bryobacterales bacterium]